MSVTFLEISYDGGIGERSVGLAAPAREVCRATAEMWEQLKRTDVDSLYNAACFRAVTAAVIKRSKTQAADTGRLANEQGDLALAWLKQAVAAGYKDAAHMAKDTDLEVLRGRDDFKKLMEELGKQKPAESKKMP